MSIKLVIFDADNTLIDFIKCEQFGLNYMCNHLNITPSAEFFSTFSKIDHSLWETGNYLGKQVLKDNIPIKRFKILFEICNIDSIKFAVANKLYMEGFKKAIFPLESSHEIIKYLYDHKIIVCVATNGLVELQYPRIKNTTFGKYIKLIVASEEVGFNKPNPLIFKKILKDTNLNSNEALVVGDSLFTDILGAQNANIKSVWYNPNKKINESGIVPDYEIYNMVELKRIVIKNDSSV